MNLYPKSILFPKGIHQGELSSDGFGPGISAICEEIHEACKGWGADKERLLKAMGSLTPDQRCKVHLQYKKMYDKELITFIKSECGSGDFGTALQLLSVSPLDAEVLLIEKACAGAGTNETVLYPILIGRTSIEMEILKKRYHDLCGKDLEKVIASELSGNLEKLMLNIMQVKEEVYDPDALHTQDKMNNDVDMLYKMGQGKWGTDEVGLFQFFVKSPSAYLHKLNLEYANKYGYTLPWVMKTEFSGHLRDAASFMLGMKLDPMDAVAGLVDKACRGLGTNELLLTTVLIRYQSVLKDVNISHMKLYEQSLEYRVASETSGYYCKLLKEIIHTGLNLSA